MSERKSNYYKIKDIIYSYLEKGKDGLDRDIRYIKEDNIPNLMDKINSIIMKRIKLNVLYRKGCDLILFDFSYEYECDIEDLSDLIEFHFCDRHDFDEMVDSCAKYVFKNFYSDLKDNNPELISYKEIN